MYSSWGKSGSERTSLMRSRQRLWRNWRISEGERRKRKEKKGGKRRKRKEKEIKESRRGRKRRRRKDGHSDSKIRRWVPPSTPVAKYHWNYLLIIYQIGRGEAFLKEIVSER